ncbi:ribosomal RNA-processing protein 7 homolog A isoform X3 [Ursus maritimus]|uniref:Ribosomal RNA-processing protein 7 homolog A n=1 Tax=Ursus maritimus TaxID=29073 RepID=A0A8M1GD42_URSMA|nr:ribosomal RNA-processing protein 7 homolog A isoform X3 [Ursus maritimus]
MRPSLLFVEWKKGRLSSLHRRHLLTHLRADFIQSKQRWCPEGTRAKRGAFSTQPEPRGRVARGAVVMETRTLPAPDCNSQWPPRLPVGKMVARRRKRGARDSEQGIPSPPGYSAIPIKFSEKQQASHYLYVREHRVREGTKSSWPQKRTLFVLNVPPYCTEDCLSRLFSPCGSIQSVELQEKPDLADSPKEPKSKFFHPMPVPGFQVAYVVFQKPGGVSAALVLKGPLLVSTESHPVKSGIRKWISSYADSVPDPEALRVEVDTFMEAYDKRIAEVGPSRGAWCHGCCGGTPEGDGRWHPVLLTV